MGSWWSKLVRGGNCHNQQPSKVVDRLDHSNDANHSSTSLNATGGPVRERSRGRTRTRTPPPLKSLHGTENMMAPLTNANVNTISPNVPSTVVNSHGTSNDNNNHHNQNNGNSHDTNNDNNTTVAAPIAKTIATTATTATNATTLHEFIWKYGGNRISLTGTFDEWRQTIIMNRDPTGLFRATINLDPHKKWIFKFVVDGIWRCSLDFPTETDEHGNVNNVIYPDE